MEILMPWGIYMSILAIVLLALCKTLYNKDDNILLNIIIMHLNKDNQYIDDPTVLYSFISDIVKLDIGYKLNHYQWDAKRNTLILFVKPAQYEDISGTERTRQLVLPYITHPIVLKEQYKRGV